MWIPLLIAAIAGYAALLILPKRLRLLYKLQQFQGPPSLPIVGNSLELTCNREDVIKVLTGWCNRYGTRFKFFLGFQPYVMMTNPLDMERIMSSSIQIEKSSDYKFLYPWLGLGLLNSKGEKWSHRRKQLTPAFHFKILEDFLRVFNEQCSTFRTILQSQRDNNTFNIFPIITHCALDIICESAMGKRVYAQQKSDSDYVTSVYRLSELFQYRQMRPWLYLDPFWKLSPSGREEANGLKILHGFTEAVIQERKRERRNTTDDTLSKKKRRAFLDLLLETQETDEHLTDMNIREEVDTFMFEGHDTTSAGVSWTTFLLACNPECQESLHEELDSIFGSDRTRDITSEDLLKMKYLECCVKEGQRIVPSVPFIGREMVQDQVLPDGTIIPEGATTFMFIQHLHKNEQVFPNPNVFDPSRFTQDNSVDRHPFAYMPFSAGPRNCIGQRFAMMEEKVMIATIFRNFVVVPADKFEDVPVCCELISRPLNGIRVMLQAR